MAYVDIIGSKNVYLHSEDHSNAAYIKNHISVGTTTEAPGGLGNKIIPSTTNITHFMYQNGLTLTGPQTFSVFAKSGGYNFIKMYMSGSTVCSANFNLSTGVVGTTGGSGFGSARIQNVGDGWYRCEVTITDNITSAQTSGGIYVTSVDGGVSPYSEAGDGTSGVFLFGNQLESGTGSSTYIKTEGSARSFAGSNGLWQYENTATVSNTYPDSADGANTTVVAGVRSYNKPDGGTVKTYLRTRKKGQINHNAESEDMSVFTQQGTTILSDNTTAPDDSLADKLVEDTSTAEHKTYLTSLNRYGTASVYLKAAEKSQVVLRWRNSPVNHTNGANINLTNGTFTSFSAAEPLRNPYIKDVGNGWYRVGMYYSYATTDYGKFCEVLLTESDDDNYNISYTGDGSSGVYIWGAQVSDGLIVTPYIKTTGTASTTIERGEVSKTYFDAQ